MSCSHSLPSFLFVRLAKASRSGLAPGQPRSQWTLWLRFLPRTHIARCAWNPVPHVAPNRNDAGTSHTDVFRRRPSVEEPRLDIQWGRSLYPAHYGNGKSACTARDYSQELWQVWNWVLRCRVTTWSETVVEAGVVKTIAIAKVWILGPTGHIRPLYLVGIYCPLLVSIQVSKLLMALSLRTFRVENDPFLSKP